MAYDNELSGRIVLDLETVASPKAAEFLDPVRPPANYKDPAKIAAYCDEKQAERIATAGLEADLCEIVAIGVWAEDETVCTIPVATREDMDEAALLAFAWEALADRAIVGFNSLAFDLPVLMRRSQLLGVPYRDVNLDRYRTPHLDLLERLTFRGALTKRSLNFYCRRFGIVVEDATTGADIAQLVAANDWQAVRHHCRSDVEKTAKLAHRLGWFRLPASQEQAVA